MLREVPFGRPIIGDEERDAVSEVLRGNILVHGPRSHEFEGLFASYTGAPYALSLSSCTAALHLCYFHLGIGSGDEVIVPAQTHTATAHAVEFTGARPVFVDAELSTGNIDIDRIEENITERTRAISVVHYLGMPVDMDRIVAIAGRHGLSVIEDCALAIGSLYKGLHAGLHGDAGCFSFYPVKHLTTAEGGMLITRHSSIADRIARQRAFGVDRTPQERSVPGVYDVTMLGFNYRMSEVHAAIGIEQMKRIEGFLARRRENYERLSEGVKDVEELSTFESSHGDFQSSYYCHSVMLNDKSVSKRFEIVQYLKERGVGTSIYYPQAVPDFTYYREKYGYMKEGYPVARRISSSSVALPVGPHLNGDDMHYVSQTLKEAIRRIG